jgi:hypothetical protein
MSIATLGGGCKLAVSESAYSIKVLEIEISGTIRRSKGRQVGRSDSTICKHSGSRDGQHNPNNYPPRTTTSPTTLKYTRASRGTSAESVRALQPQLSVFGVFPGAVNAFCHSRFAAACVVALAFALPDIGGGARVRKRPGSVRSSLNPDERHELGAGGRTTWPACCSLLVVAMECKPQARVRNAGAYEVSTMRRAGDKTELRFVELVTDNRSSVVFA